MQARTTIIIPNYNGLNFMEPCFEALEKQIPKEIKRNKNVFRCPNCNECLDLPEMLDCCYRCGQALDWSVEDVR